MHWKSGAEDVIVNDDKSMDVITTPEDFSGCEECAIKQGFSTSASGYHDECRYQCGDTDKETAEKVINLIDTLEDLDDVQSVYSNADISQRKF